MLIYIAIENSKVNTPIFFYLIKQFYIKVLTDISIMVFIYIDR